MRKQPEVTEQTKRNIMDAFWQLAQESSISAVNVSAVMKRAGYNRGTFYVYFTDIPDLIAQTEQEMLTEFRGVLTEVFENGLAQDIPSITSIMLRKMSRFGDRMFILLGKGGDPNFVSMVRNEAIRSFPLPVENKEYIISFVLSALVGVLTYWYENGKKEDLKDVIRVTYSLVSNALPKQITQLNTIY